jgi:hypothetical protein
MQLTFNIPDHCLPPQRDENTVAQQLKRHSTLLLFQPGQLSRGAACEFADVDIYTFFAAGKEYPISVINMNEDEVEADVLRFDRRHPV